MADRPLERIHIRDLSVRCIVGVNDDERHERQDVIINVTLHADLRKACGTDNIDDTVDYKTIKKAIVDEIETSNYFLIERMAERVAEICLAYPVERVDVTVDKPGALRFARSVAVEISRSQA